jgi:anti-anti-sigma regulatory factor
VAKSAALAVTQVKSHPLGMAGHPRSTVAVEMEMIATIINMVTMIMIMAMEKSRRLGNVTCCLVCPNEKISASISICQQSEFFFNVCRSCGYPRS